MEQERRCSVKRVVPTAVLAGLLALTVFVGTKTGMAQDTGHRPGQDLWRSCSACHCVPDRRIPEDEDWLKLNETTTCISGAKDTPEARRALIAYLRSKETMRPLLIDEQYEPPAGVTCGKIRVPSTAGSAYLKAERKSVRAGSPGKIRLHWKGSEKGTTLALPAGEFRVISYAFYRSDKKGRQWSASGTSAEGCTQLIIRSDKDAAFDLLPEIQAHLSCEEDEDEDRHVLGFFMTNRNNKRMSISREGKLVNPRWVITGAEGQRVDAGDFEVT
jgi:hypothetical protein